MFCVRHNFPFIQQTHIKLYLVPDVVLIARDIPVTQRTSLWLHAAYVLVRENKQQVCGQISE
jgi:hypothetical protein